MPRQNQSKGQDRTLKKSGKLNKNEAKRREEKLKMNLHLAEIGQVEEYIKNRSLEVDQEIEDTRKRMNLSMSMSNDNSRNDAAKHFTVKSNLHVDGQKLKEGMLKNDSNHPTKSAPPKIHTERTSDMGSKNSTKDIEWMGLKERLVSSLQDAGMTPFQVTETFLPSELARENEVYLLLEEVIDVFQIDFVNPVTESDKAILLHFYGDKHATFVNIKDLLTDLAYWDTSWSHDSTSSQYSRNGKQFEEDEDLDHGLPDHFKNKTYGGHASTDMLKNSGDAFGNTSNATENSHHRLLSATNPVPKGSLYPITETAAGNLDTSSEMLANEHRNTAMNRSALADIHALVHSSTGDFPNTNLLNFDNFRDDEIENKDKQKEGLRHQSVRKEDAEIDDKEEENDEQLLAQLRRHIAHKSMSQVPTGNQSMPTETITQDKHGVSGDNTDKSIREVAAENVATQLALENARLKQELGAFDSEFFEELEDLKFKYAKLQVGVFEGCSLLVFLPIIRFFHIHSLFELNSLNGVCLLFMCCCLYVHPGHG
mgnify:CR=1 FL=1